MSLIKIYDNNLYFKNENHYFIIFVNEIKEDF